LRLESGQIITAGALLAASDAQRKRAAVDAAISTFGLDPTNAADVLGAQAYVWAQHYAPMKYSGLLTDLNVPWSGPKLESVSQSIMALELARPGTLNLALAGDQRSEHYLDTAVEDGLENGAIFESRPRPPNLPRELQTTSESARTALNLRTNDQMQAHHLIPANVWGKRPDLARLALEAGWSPNSLVNLIELPANLETQKKLEAEGVKLPIHSSRHDDYDKIALGQIIKVEAEYGRPLTPVMARSIFEKVSTVMRVQILDGVWMPKLH
jgi:hypothetical protein